MKKILFLILATIICSQIFAFGAFNLFNQRNHPELDWKSIETKNCIIVYHEPLLEFAQETADVAEQSYQTLSKSYRFNPKTKCIIYVSDQDNIANGATVLTHYIFIWVNQNDFTNYFTGNDKWIRKVVSHEMSHWFVFSSIKDWMYPYLPLSVINFPGTLNEGFAQFFSGEPWGYNRGDRFVKTAIFSNKEVEPSQSFEGGLLYGAGFSMIRYLQTEYGEESLTKLLQYRNKGFLFNFEEAFKKVYDKDFNTFTEEWRRHVSTYYYGQAYLSKIQDTDKDSKDLTINSKTDIKSNWSNLSEIIWKDNSALFIGKQSNNQGFNSLVYAKIVNDSLKKKMLFFKENEIIENAGSFTSIAISPNDEWIAYSRYTRQENGSLAPQVFRYSRQTYKTDTFGRGNLVQIDNEGGLYFHKLDRESSKIHYISPNANQTIFLNLNRDNQVGELKLSPDLQKLAITLFDENKKFLVSVYDVTNQKVISAIELPHMAQNIYWQSNEELIISTERSNDFKLTIFNYNIKNKALTEFKTPPFNISPIRISTENDTIYAYSMMEFNRGALSLGKTRIIQNDNSELKVEQNYYTKWIDTNPEFSIPDSIMSCEKSPVKDYQAWKNLKWRQGMLFPTANYLFGSFVVSEALGKHTLSGTGILPYNNDKDRDWVMMYANNCFTPTITLMVAETKWFAGMYEDKVYYQNMKNITASASFPVDLNTPFTSANYGLALHYNDIKKSSDDYLLFENKHFSNAEAFARYTYNLPWKNAFYHPVSKFQIDYKIQNASDKLGMNLDYTQHTINLQSAYAPLIFKAIKEYFRTINITNKINYEAVTGEQLSQFLPGIDEYEYIQSTGQPMFKRMFLRGFEVTTTGKRFLNIQNELNFKLSDDFLLLNYSGVALFADYSKIWKQTIDNKDKEYKAMGVELKASINLLGFNVLSKYGFAYDYEGNKLDEYYLFEIPFSAHVFE